MNHGDLINKIERILLNLSKEKPWMTSKGLSGKLNISVSVQDIETALISNCKKPGRKIRYSYYPSKKTLDILWGHTCHVGEQRNLPALYRTDEIEESLHYRDCRIDESAPWFFISHNFRDFQDVLNLQNVLEKNGYGAWLFESEIARGENIANHVQIAIENCDYIIIYISRRSLGSLWVRKEYAVSTRGGKNPYVFIDGLDLELLRLLASGNNSELVNKFASEYAANFSLEVRDQRRQSWTSRCHEFLYVLTTKHSEIESFTLFPSACDKTIYNSHSYDNLETFFRRISNHRSMQ